MEAKSLVALYRMPQPALAQECDKGLMLIDRDGDLFLKSYGINDEFKDKLFQKNDLFKNTPSDAEILSILTFKTRDRDAVADQCRMAIRSLMLKVKNKFGENSLEYKSFGTGGMNKLNGKELFFLVKTVNRAATTYLLPLAEKGVTQATIDELTQLGKNLDAAIDEKDKAERQRANATAERISLGNEIYKMLVELYDYGKDYWVSRDVVKFSEYILYNTPTGKPETPTATGVLTGRVTDAATNNPLAGVTITIIGTQITMQTDENGDYGRDGIPAGKNNVSATLTGYAPSINQNVEIIADEETTVDFVMRAE